jgi:plasmid stability protein/predicted nucleic acid-binding protein
MAVVTVRNLRVETLRALKRRAARHNRSTEAEIREILEKTAWPKNRVKIGLELAAFGQSFGGLPLDMNRDQSETEQAQFEWLSSTPMSFQNRWNHPVIARCRIGSTGKRLKPFNLTATSLSELLVGIDRLPDGKRKKGLDIALHEFLARLFEDRILPFDNQAAVAYAPLISRARASGATISVADGQIAAIATVHGFSVATRDAAPFVAAGVAVINPWEEEQGTNRRWGWGLEWTKIAQIAWQVGRTGAAAGIRRRIFWLRGTGRRSKPGHLPALPSVFFVQQGVEVIMLWRHAAGRYPADFFLCHIRHGAAAAAICLEPLQILILDGGHVIPSRRLRA